MGLSTIPKMIIGLAVCIILIASLTVPVIDGFENKTYYKNTDVGIVSMTKAETVDDTITIVVDHTTGAITVDGETITVNTSANNVYWPIMTNNLYLLLRTGANPIGGVYQFDGTAKTSLFMSGMSDDLTITIADDDITFAYEVSGEDVTFTASFTYIFYPDNKGSYTNVPASKTVYVTDVNDIYFASLENNTALVYGKGTTATMNGSSVTATITSSSITGVQTVKSVSSITVPISGTDTTVTGGLIVDSEVSGVNDQLNQYKSLMQVLPLLLIAAVLIGAVVMIRMK